MVDQELLAAIGLMMDNKLEPIKSDLNELKADVSVLKADVSELKDRVSSLEKKVTKIEVVQENVTNKNIKVLFESQQGINEKFQKLDRIEIVLNNVKSETEVIRDIVSSHSKILSMVQ